MTQDTSTKAAEALAQDFDERVEIHARLIAGPCGVLLAERGAEAAKTHSLTASLLRALAAERDQLRRELAEARNAALEEGYLEGFKASGQGWNGEYPYADYNACPTTDVDWVKFRDERIASLKSTPAPRQSVQDAAKVLLEWLHSEPEDLDARQVVKFFNAIRKQDGDDFDRVCDVLRALSQEGQSDE